MSARARLMLMIQLSIVALLFLISSAPGASAAPASLSVDSPTEGATVTDSRVVFDLTAPDADDIQCKFDDEPNWNYCWFAESRGLTNGPHVAHFRSVVYGSTTEYGSVVTRVFTVADNTPPAIVMSHPSQGETLTTDVVRPSFTIDGRSGVYLTCLVDGVSRDCEDGYTRLNLANGPHTISMSSSDPAGNTGTLSRDFTVDDTTPPEIVVTSPADGSTITDRNGLTLRFTVDGASAQASCSFNGSTFKSCWNYDDLPDLWTVSNGAGKTLAVSATDAQGRTATVSSTFSVAIPDPVVVVSRPAEGVVIGTTSLVPKYTIDGDEGWDGYCRIDGGSWRFCESGYTSFTALANGIHTFEVRVNDAFNNPLVTGPISFTVADEPGPSITIDSPAEGATLASSVLDLGFDSTDASSLLCSLDGRSFYCGTDGYYYDEFDVANGSHQLVISGSDYQGQTSTVTRNFTVLDNVAPSLALVTPANGATLQSDKFSLDFTTDSPSAAVSCTLDGAPRYCYDGYRFSILNGPHTLAVKITDGAGNSSSATTSFTVNDLTPPELVVSSPAQDQTFSSGSVPFSYSVDGDSNGDVECSIDGNYWSEGCTYSSTLQLLAGSHSLSVRASDANGHTALVTRDFSVSDSTPPVVQITSPTNGTAFFGWNATIGYSVNEATRRVTCLVDGVMIATNTYSSNSCYSTDYGWIGNGPHVVTVLATDIAGNTASAVANVTVADTTDPLVSIYAPSEGQTLTDSNLSLGFSLSVPTPEHNGAIASSECRIDSRPWQFCATYSFRPNSLANGPHTVSVRATDSEGRKGVATRAFVVNDTSPPAFTINNPSVGEVVDGDLLSVSTSSNSAASWRCGIDAQIQRNCSGGWWDADIRGLDPGEHHVTVTATDPAGNSNSQTRSFVIPTPVSSSPMNLQITEPGPGATVGSSFFVRYTSQRSLVHRLYGSVDGSEERRLKVNATGWWPGALHNGPHSVTLRAVDDVGNSQSVSVNVNVLDASPPSIEITSPSEGATVGVSPPRIRFAADSDIETSECKVDARPFEPCNSAFAYRPKNLTNGPHTATVRVTDLAGTVGQDSISFVLADTTPPSFSVTTPSEGAAISEASNARLALAIPNADAFDDVACTVNGQPYPADGDCKNGTRLQDLPVGAVALAITLTDGVGNSFTVVRHFTNSTPVDTSAPLVSFKLPKSGSVFTDSTDAWTSWSAFDYDEFGHPVNYVPTECQADGGAWSPCGSYINVFWTFMHGLPATNGTHQFSLRAVDAAGNTGSATLSYSVQDTTPPDLAIITPSDGAAVDSRSAWVEFEAEKFGGSVCSLDSGDFHPCISGFVLGSEGDPLIGPGTALEAGAHVLRVRTFDPAGNQSTAQTSFTVNANSLDTSFASGPSGLINDATPEWALTSVPSGLPIECRVDSGGWADAVGGAFAPSMLADGAHTVACRSISGGDRDSTPASRLVTIDTVAPETSFVNAPLALSTNPTPYIALSSNESAATVQCSLDSGAWMNRPTSFTLESQADGPHTLLCAFKDPAGNIDAAPASASFTVDTIAPVTTFNAFSALTNSVSPVFSFTRSESGTTQCRLDGGPTTSYMLASSYGPGPVTEGARTLECRSQDPAGNIGEFASASFTVDLTSPEVSITAPAAGAVTGNAVSVEFTATDAHLGSVECARDALAYAACASPKSWSGLTEGPHTLRVRAFDLAGNLTTRNVEIVVDTIPPDTTATPSASLLTSDSTPSLLLSSSEPGSKFQCRIDDAEWSSLDASTAYTTPTLSDGSHQIECRAVDAAGNPDPTPAAVSRTIDTIAPALSITSPSSGATVAVSRPEVAFTVSDLHLQAVGCRVDQSSFVDCTSPWTAPELTDGPHTIDVRAIDSVGNSTTESLQLIVDAPDPVAYAGDDRGVTAGDTVQFDGSPSSPSEQITEYSWSFGDGATSTSVSPAHVYASPGTYTASLTVRLGGRTNTDTAKITVGSPAGEDGVSVAVSDAGGPLAGADVALVLADGSRIQAATSSGGMAVLRGVPDGEFYVYAYKSGYRAQRKLVTVADGLGSASIELEPGSVGTASIETHLMSPEEMEAVGINVNDPSNYRVVKFEIGLAISGRSFNITGHSGTNWSSFSFGGGGGGGGCVTISGSTLNCGGSWIRMISTGPTLVFMVMEGEAKFLKEFHSVSMTVVNTSDAGISFGPGTATLALPPGLSLAPMIADPQSLSNAMSPIPAGESQTTTWYVRGDDEGEYDLSAKYRSTLEPLGSPIEIDAQGSKPLKIWGASALKLLVDADSEAVSGEPYRVRLGLKNVADIPVYNASLAMNPAVHQNFIYQPREIYKRSRGVIPAGDTWWSEFTVVPTVTGSLDLANSYVAMIGGTDELESELTSSVREEPLSLKAYKLPGKVVLDWAPVPGVDQNDYAAFSTVANDEPFPAGSRTITKTATNGDPLSADGTKAIIRTEETDDYFAVSPMAAGKPRMAHPMLKPIPAQGPSAAASAGCHAPGEETAITLDFSSEALPLDGYTNLRINGEQIGGGSGELSGEHAERTFYVESAGFAGNSVEVDVHGIDGDSDNLEVDDVGRCQMAAIGDSYSSGEGTGDYLTDTHWQYGNQCDQSLHAYPFQFVESLGDGAPDFGQSRFHACSGAVIRDIVDDSDVGIAEPTSRQKDENGTVVRQIDQVSSPGAVDVLTLTIGGNDMGFADVVGACVKDPELVPLIKLFANCPAAILDAVMKFPDASLKLPRLYNRLAQKFPNARIYVLGYPQIFPTTPQFLSSGGVSGTCLAVQPGEFDAMHIAIDAFNRRISAAVDDHNASHSGNGRGSVNFVPITGFSGHDVCDADAAWFRGVTLHMIPGLPPSFNIQESFHPNTAGHADMADELADFVRAQQPSRGSFLVNLGQTVSKLFTVPAGLKSGSFSIKWPGSDVELKLTSPSGVQYSGQGTPGSTTHSETDTSESFTIEQPEAGSWRVDMTGVEVDEGGEKVDLAFDSVNDTNLPPMPAASVTPNAPATVDQVFAFDGSASSDPDGSLTAFEWDFGDGSSSTQASPNHKYAVPGTYYPRLTVTDNRNESVAQSLDPIIVNASSGPSGPTGPTGSTGSTGSGGGPGGPNGSVPPPTQAVVPLYGTIDAPKRLKLKALARSRSLNLTVGSLSSGVGALAELFDGKKLLGSSKVVRGSGGDVRLVIKLNSAGKKRVKSRPKLRRLTIRVEIRPAVGSAATIVRTVRLSP